MSYEIVKSIAIKDDKVFITSAANNVHPRTFERWESKSLSEIYNKQGLEPLLKVLGAQVWEGNFHLQKGGSQLTKSLQAGCDVLCYKSALRSFLDTEHASEYMAKFVLNTMGLAPMPDVSKLDALRKDKEAVLAICKNRPDAFNYADPAIQKDRATAKKYIETCGDLLMFRMPVHFSADKELAKLALEKCGVTYRHLDYSIRADKELTNLAFDMNLPRKYFEHLPDLIPESLRKDKAFMTELVACCPRMHITRAPELLQDKDIVSTWLSSGCWGRYNLQEVPQPLLKDPQIQQVIFSSAATEEIKEAARQYLTDIGALPAKPPLSDILKAAENKKADLPQQGREQEPQR